MASGQYDSLDSALLYLQIIGMISSFQLRWHSNLHVLNTFLSLINFDVDFLTPDCILGEGAWGPLYSFSLQLALPFLFTVGYGMYFSLHQVLLRRCFFGRLLAPLMPYSPPPPPAPPVLLAPARLCRGSSKRSQQRQRQG